MERRKEELGSRLIDLSHTIMDGLVTYKGLPAPVVCDYLSREESRKMYEPGTEFQIAKIEMVANTGTYMDVPFHRFGDGHDLSEVSLERVAELPGVVVRMPYSRKMAVSSADLCGIAVHGRAVLIHTGWDEHWNTPAYYSGHPFLTADAAAFLRDSGARLVGIDSHNIDDTSGRSRPVHTTLLGAGILIVEHLCGLSAVPDDGFVFSAVPPKFKGVGTWPVRAMVRVER
jgi:kynurenine formamidase